MRVVRRTFYDADDGENNYLASVSDLVSGLLFIFIITLMVFALGLKNQERVKQDEVERLTGADRARQQMLEAVQQRLLSKGVRVTIDPKQGVLRLEEGILFEFGRADLGDEGQNVVDKLGDVFDEVLPCYTAPRADSSRCPSRAGNGELDALFIEGHTDDQPITVTREFRDNWELSTARARAVYLALTENHPGLAEMKNPDHQSILSLSGYADQRGVVKNDSPDNRRLNRRIDLRFVMSAPKLPAPARDVSEHLGQTQ